MATRNFPCFTKKGRNVGCDSYFVFVCDGLVVLPALSDEIRTSQSAGCGVSPNVRASAHAKLTRYRRDVHVASALGKSFHDTRAHSERHGRHLDAARRLVAEYAIDDAVALKHGGIRFSGQTTSRPPITAECGGLWEERTLDSQLTVQDSSFSFRPAPDWRLMCLRTDARERQDGPPVARRGSGTSREN
jgi:hypothetical protein